MMTSRERVLAAIRHETPDRVPVDAMHIENTGAVARYLGIAPNEVAARLGIDGRVVCPVSDNYAAWLERCGADAPLSSYVTEWGCPYAKDYGTVRGYPLGPDATLADVKRYAWPDPAAYDFSETGEQAREMGDRHALRGPSWRPIFSRVCDLLSLEGTLTKMLTEPEVVEAAIEGVFDYTYRFCELFLDACGDAVPILALADDVATQRGLMMSPDVWRRFLKPYCARLFELGKRRGKHIWFHSCGDITAILPDLIEIGMDVWETVQLHTLPVSPEELKRQYGRDITFFGAINTQRLPFASPEEVRQEVESVIRALGKGGGYICGPDHHLQVDVSAENTLALFDTAIAFRGESYTL